MRDSYGGIEMNKYQQREAELRDWTREGRARTTSTAHARAGNIRALTDKVARLKADYAATNHAGWRRLMARNTYTVDPSEPGVPDALLSLARAETKLARLRALNRHWGL